MGINILLITVAALLVAGMSWGWKRGLIEGVVRLASSILGCCVLLVTAQGIYGFMKGGIASVAVTLLLFAIIGFIQKFVKFITNTFKLVKCVPFGKSADRLAGAVFGCAQALCVIWLAFILIGSFDLFGLKQWLMENAEQNSFLRLLYDTNYLMLLLQRILELVSVGSE